MISCQLAEWSFDGSKTVYTQAMTYAESPDVVKLNTKVVTIDASLYRGISHRHKGIRLLNNMQCDFAYSWGAPLGSDTNNMHCALEPTNGMVNGKGSVEFELVITPRTTVRILYKPLPSSPIQFLPRPAPSIAEIHNRVLFFGMRLIPTAQL